MKDFFESYREHYLKKYILQKSDFQESIKYDDIINLLSNYILHSKTEKEESDRFHKKHKNFSDMLKTENNDQRYDAWVDSVFNMKDEINHDRQSIIQISKRQNKNMNHPSWESINKTHTALGDMTETQKELVDIIHLLKESSQKAGTKSASWAINKIIRNLQYVLKQEVEPVNVNYSPTKKNRQEEEYMGVVISKILSTINYSNPNSIYGLIISYNELWCKYRDQVGSPIYTILKEFKLHADKIKLKNEQQQQILHAFLTSYNGKIKKRDRDGKKEIAQKLGMDTEKMMRSLKGSISNQISKYFEKHVGI